MRAARRLELVQGGCEISGDADSRSPSRGGARVRLLASSRCGGGLDVSPDLLSGQEPLQGQPEYVRAAAQAMLGGDEVAADEHGEGEHAANLDLLLVGAECAE
jgi:hypothetical protein